LDKRRAAKGTVEGNQPSVMLALLRDGLALQRQNRLDDAALRYRRILELDPSQPQACHLLGLVEHQRGDQERAAALITRAVAAGPSNADFRADLGVVLRAMRRFPEARQSLVEADRLRPHNPRILSLLATSCLDMGEPAEAVACYRQAIAAAPNDASLHSNLGNVLNLLGDTEAALASFRRALELDPASAVTRSNFGHTLAGTGALDEAIAQYHEALRLDPDALAARINLGLAFAHQGRLEEADNAFRTALAANPKAVDAIAGYASVLERRGNLSEALRQYDLILKQRPDDVMAMARKLFLQNYLGDGNLAEIVSGARHFGSVLARAAGPTLPHENDRQPERRLRIGLVSGDLRLHPVGRFLVGPLAEIDPQKLELFAYSTQIQDDELTTRMQRSIPNWRQVAHLTSEHLADAIRADRIDILVDLSGNTGASRLSTFARKPAPVAVTWLGYFATTGVETIDYVLCNEVLVPREEEWQWVERPWRMPGTYFCFSTPSVDVPVSLPPCLESGFVTFGSFNNLNKLSDGAAQVWSDVLKAVPRSRLLLRAEALQNAETIAGVYRRFADLGISPERLQLEGYLSDYAAHLAGYNRVDIALDSFPYAGGTTTVESLWMGVPVITHKGDRFVSHMGENILYQAGLADWIAADTGAFIAKAAGLAADQAALAAVRANLRPMLAASPLFDARGFARDLEQAFREMWRIWCANEQGGP